MLRRDFLQAGTLAGLSLHHPFRANAPTGETPGRGTMPPALPQQEATVADLAEQLQKVSAQVQMNTPAMRVAAENR